MASPEQKQKKTATEEEFEKAEFEKEEFSYDKVYNNKEFLGFLSKYEDVESLEFTEENKEEIAKRFESFENKKFLETNITELYKSRVETAFGMPLDEEAESKIAESLEKEALDNPERLERRVMEVRTFFELTKRYNEAEAAMERYGGKENHEEILKTTEEAKAEAEKKKSVAEWAVGIKGSANPKNWTTLGWLLRKFEDREVTELRKEIREAPKKKRLEVFNDIDNRIDYLTKKEEFIKNYPTKQEMIKDYFDQFNKEIFANFEASKYIFEKIQEKAADKLQTLILNPEEGLKSLDEASEYIEQIESAKKIFSPESLKDLDLEAFKNGIDFKVLQLATDQVKKLVRRFNIENGPLDNLKKALGEYLDRSKLGAMEQKEFRVNIARVFQGEMERLKKLKPSEKKKRKNYKEKIVYLNAIAAYLSSK